MALNRAMADGGRSNADIARRLIALRESRGMNQSAFAAFIGISQPAMNNYERGLRRPELDVAINIQVKTGATLDWVYVGDRSGLPAHLLAVLPDLSDDAPQMRVKNPLPQ
jgi:transcriptional regulator with XRE-family HTH domain